jgi:type II secretory pathway component PulF
VTTETTNPFQDISPNELSSHEKRRLREVLDSSLSQREFLQAYLNQPLSNHEATVVRNLLSALEKEKEPTVWISTPSLAAALPFVLRFHRLDKLSPSDLTDLVGTLQEYTKEKPVFWRALAYPLFLTLLTFCFLILVGLFLIPIFAEMYSDFGIQLPIITEMLVQFSMALRFSPLLTVIGLFIVLISFFLFLPASISVLQNFQRAPIIGVFFSGSRSNIAALNRWISVIAELVDCDFRITHAIRIAAVASQSRYLTLISNDVIGELLRTQSIHPSVPNLFYFSELPGTVTHALLSDKQRSPALLRQIAAAQRMRLSEREDRLGGLLNPFTTIFVGLLVAVVVIGLFLPLLSVLTALSW